MHGRTHSRLICFVGLCSRHSASAARLSSKEQLAAFLTRGGVAVGKVARAVREIERKTFHLAGVLIPLWYQIITSVYGWSDSACVSFAAVVTAVVWGSEVARLYVNTSLSQKTLCKTLLHFVSCYN